MPAQNARSPRPVSTTARTAVSRRSARQTRESSSVMAGSNVLSTSGRSSVTVATPSATSSASVVSSSWWRSPDWLTGDSVGALGSAGALAHVGVVAHDDPAAAAPAIRRRNRLGQLPGCRREGATSGRLIHPLSLSLSLPIVERLTNILHRQLGRLVAGTLRAVVRVSPRSDEPAPISLEIHAERLGLFVDLEVRIGAPLGGDAAVRDTDVLEDPAEPHSIRVEDPGAVARLDDHDVHASTVPLDACRAVGGTWESPSDYVAVR